MKQKWILFFIVTLLISARVNAQTYKDKLIHVGVSLGVGLPKIPLSSYRSPISVLGGGLVKLRMCQKIGLQFNGYGLTTFSLGTVNNQKDRLKFDLIWGSLDIQYHLRGVIQNKIFLIVSVGTYNLLQQFETTEEAVNTGGAGIGITNWHSGKMIDTFLELRWHLLFNPDPKPQILTISYGIVF